MKIVVLSNENHRFLLKIKMKKKEISGVYVLGTGRSGTTMMNKLLASHPDIVGVMQVEILKKFSYDLETTDNLIKEVAENKKEAEIVKKYFKKNKISSELSKSNPYKFMHDYCSAHADHFKKTFYTEKSPIHSLFAEEILKKIPNSKVLIIIRDPRATILSKNNAFTANRGKIYNFPLFLRHKLNLSEVLFTYKYFDKIYSKYKNSKRVHFTNYDDLVSNPKKELKKIYNSGRVMLSEKESKKNS